MIGNKLDLKHQRQIEEKEGEIYAKENGWGFHEITTTSAYQIDTLFTACGEYSYNEKVKLWHDQRGEKLKKHKHKRDDKKVTEWIIKDTETSNCVPWWPCS